MIETVFQSADLPAADRFDTVRNLMSLAPVPMDISSEHTAGLLVHQRDLHLDAIRAWTMALGPMAFRRTEKLIERSDPETVNVCLLLDGAMARSWGADQAVYKPGELHIRSLSMTRPPARVEGPPPTPRPTGPVPRGPQVTAAWNQ
ncbi:MAG: hypothetical protein ACRDS0_34770 [Pseudonocardiaceae bacterium]